MTEMGCDFSYRRPQTPSEYWKLTEDGAAVQPYDATKLQTPAVLQY